MIVDEWDGMYPSNWRGILTPESISHPAKFSSKLIENIYKHAIAEGWLYPGARVLDCFSGVASGAFPALRYGMHYTGIEIEPHFVELGRGNIAAWNAKYSGRLNRWGTARVLHGDSRYLAQVIAEADSLISSPPYGDRSAAPNVQGYEAGGLSMNEGQTYGKADGQLGAMPIGDYQGILASPPYADSMERKGGIDPDKSEHVGGPNSQMNRSDTRYGSADGQLGSMRLGDYASLISSPPFLQAQGGCNVTSTTGPLSDPRLIRRHSAGNQSANAYGNSDGQISNLNEDTFWGASKLIVEQCYRVLAPGAVAIWVVKGFIRRKRLVDFPGQWRALCESVGFTTIHEHHAMFTQHKGTSLTIEGEQAEHKTSSKSFFRRIAEKKGAPPIDFETILCMRKES